MGAYKLFNLTETGDKVLVQELETEAEALSVVKTDGTQALEYQTQSFTVVVDIPVPE